MRDSARPTRSASKRQTRRPLPGRLTPSPGDFEKGCFRDAVHVQNAYEEVKRTARPQSAAEMWALWVAEVNRRIAAARIERTPA